MPSTLVFDFIVFRAADGIRHRPLVSKNSTHPVFIVPVHLQGEGSVTFQASR